jgi:Protein of unknown function with HXXEE motif
VNRVLAAFAGLVAAQAAHSTEEYVQRLWETFPPARFVASLISLDLERNFLVINICLVAFGVWCLCWPLRRDWPSARPLAWGWAIIESGNGTIHLLWTLAQGHYTPGVATAPLLLLLALNLGYRLRATPQFRASGRGARFPV